MAYAVQECKASFLQQGCAPGLWHQSNKHLFMSGPRGRWRCRRKGKWLDLIAGAVCCFNSRRDGLEILLQRRNKRIGRGAGCCLEIRVQ